MKNTRNLLFLISVFILLQFSIASANRKLSAANLSSQPGNKNNNQSLPQGCSSFCLDNNGYAIFGANYDYVKNKHDGLVIVNKRNVSKSFRQPDSLGEHICWTSKYGSVSFNFIASQTSWTGMNEAGLVIYSMRLEEGSKPPAPDQRQWISAHHWLQYMLDNFSTIEEVIASDSTLRVFSSGRIPHYLVSDRYGNCATIEFMDGKTVIHAGKNLPVKVLANTAYASSIAEWENITLLKNNKKPIPPTGTSSRGRFLRAVERVTPFKPADSETAVKIAFDILKDISRANTNWSIVYDTKNLQIHFKTIVHSAIRMIDLQKLDFSCQSPVKLIDINEKLAGDITDQLKDYTFEYHFDHALRAAKKYELEMTADELKKYIRDIEEFPCHDNSTSAPQYLDQKPPGLTPELFAPGIVSTGLDELNSVFSPDGTEFYFCVRKPGAVSIFQIKLENGFWSKPALLPFASRFGEIDVSLSLDGNKLFFSSRRPVSDNADPKSDFDFWMVDRVGASWGKPVHLGMEINSDRDDFYPMMAQNGTLYFSSQREGPGTNNIYRSRLVNGHYLKAEKLDSTINFAYRDFDPYISPDESLLIFASARPGGFGAEDLYISFRQADGAWTPAKNMGDKINSPGAEYCPMLSPDGKFLFFTGARRTQPAFPEQPMNYAEFVSNHNLPQNLFSDIYWLDAKIIDELKPKKNHESKKLRK